MPEAFCCCWVWGLAWCYRRRLIPRDVSGCISPMATVTASAVVRIVTIRVALTRNTHSTGRICRRVIRGNCRHSITTGTAIWIVRSAGTAAGPITRSTGSMSSARGTMVGGTARGKAAITGRRSVVSLIRNADTGAPEVQRFLHCGSRFSRKALTPSRVSWASNRLRKASRSVAPSVSGPRLRTLSISGLMARIATGL